MPMDPEYHRGLTCRVNSEEAPAEQVEGLDGDGVDGAWGVLGGEEGEAGVHTSRSVLHHQAGCSGVESGAVNLRFSVVAEDRGRP